MDQGDSMTYERAYDIIWEALRPFELRLTIEQQTELDSLIDKAAEKIAFELACEHNARALR
jgi:hypothetical protein